MAPGLGELHPPDPFGDVYGQSILTMPGLSGEDKLAWRFLRLLSKRTFENFFTVTPREVGNDQGVTSDAGRARLRNLEKKRLIKVDDQGDAGWRIRMVAPHVGADNLAKKLDDNADARLKEFVDLLRRSVGRKQRAVALEFCSGNEKRADALERQYQRYKRRHL